MRPSSISLPPRLATLIASFSLRGLIFTNVQNTNTSWLKGRGVIDSIETGGVWMFRTEGSGRSLENASLIGQTLSIAVVGERRSFSARSGIGSFLALAERMALTDFGPSPFTPVSGPTRKRWPSFEVTLHRSVEVAGSTGRYLMPAASNSRRSLICLSGSLSWVSIAAANS